MHMRRLIGCILLCLFSAFPATGFAQKPKVLILAADDPQWANEVRTTIAASDCFAQVDLFDMRSSTPSLAFLRQYKAILAYDNYTPSAGIGNVLADYVDQGGGLVISAFANASIPFDGRINTSEYQVLVSLSQTQGTLLTMGNISMPHHPIMQGVTHFNGGTSTYHSTSTTLSPRSYIIASYSNGAPLILAKENVGLKKMRRVDLNLFPPSSGSRSDFWSASTDGAKIMTNALLWVARTSPTSGSKILQAASLEDRIDAHTTEFISLSDRSTDKSPLASVSSSTEMRGYQLGQIYPNPASTMASVKITLPHASMVTLNLVSTTGQVYEVASGHYQVGESTIDITTSHIPNGSYFYVLSNEEIRISRQMIVVR